MTQNQDEIMYLKPALLELEVDDHNKDYASVINESSFRINLVPSEELIRLFNRFHFTRNGRFTWSRHVRYETASEVGQFIREYAQNFTPFTLVSSESKAANISINQGAFEPRTVHRLDYAQNYFDNNRGSQTGTYSGNIQELRGLANFWNEYQPFSVELKDEYRLMMQRHHRTIYDAYRNDGGNRRDFSIFTNSNAVMKSPDAVRNEFSPAILYVYMKNDVFWVKMLTTPNLVGRMEDSWQSHESFEEFFNTGRKKINGPGASTQVSSNYHARWEIEPVIDWINTGILTENVWDSENSQKAFDMLDKVKDKYTVGYAPGKPATALIMRGKAMKKSHGFRLKAGEHKNLSVKRILEVQQANPDVDFVIHPALLDIVNMNKATDFNDNRLRKYQKVAVGLHLSTDIGYLNASDPGLGKSVMQLTAMRERAETIDYYRGIIISEANVRQQWKEYADTWFPDAETCVLTKSNQTGDLIKALSSEKPVIIIVSYSLAGSAFTEREKRVEREAQFAEMSLEEKMESIMDIQDSPVTVGELLLDSHWNDICADEAVCIRNGASKQAKAMWELRGNSDVAVALTGTPVNKNPDDMAKLLEWVRNDKKLFQGSKLSEAYDSETLAGATQMFNDLTPLVFRRERNEVKNEGTALEDTLKMPDMKSPVSILLTPNAAEKSLAHAAEKELKRVYLELIAAIEAVEGSEGVDAEAVKEAKEQLRNAHGQWLGGTQLARMATSDPASLMKSDSVGASLLVGQGLVANAMEVEPTKRKEFIKRAHNHIQKGQSILVFTEFASVADALVQSLEDNGIRAGAFTGKNLVKRERNRTAFQNGELDVLVCTKAGERGLTLHKASAVYHYDMPWTIERLQQRIGRALRVGSENAEVEVFFMILEDTVEERVAKQVLSQGTAASMILDASRGVDVSKTALGSTMAGLMSTSKSLASRKGALEFGKALNLV